MNHSLFVSLLRQALSGDYWQPDTRVPQITGGDTPHPVRTDAVRMDTPVVDLDCLDDGAYLEYHQKRDEGTPGYNDHRQQVRELLGPLSGQSIAEIGCGTGAHLPTLAASAQCLWAVDTSQRMLDLAAKRLGEAGVEFEVNAKPEAGSRVSLTRARLEDLQYSKRFDSVLADRLIGHLPNPVDGLRALTGLTRPGGILVVVNMLNAATTVSMGPLPSDRALARSILSWRAEQGTTSAWAAAVLPALAIEAGLLPVSAQCWTFTCRSLIECSPHSPVHLYGEHAYAAGAISRAEADRWSEALHQQDTQGAFAATITVRADVLAKPARQG